MIKMDIGNYFGVSVSGECSPDRALKVDAVDTNCAPSTISLSIEMGVSDEE